MFLEDVLTQQRVWLVYGGHSLFAQCLGGQGQVGGSDSDENTPPVTHTHRDIPPAICRERGGAVCKGVRSV